MRRIMWILAVFSGCAILMATEISCFAVLRVPPPEVATLATLSAPPNETTDLTLWVPVHKEFELAALPENQNWPMKPTTDSETLARPAWGMLAAVLIAFLVLWTNTGFTARMIGSGTW